MKNIEIETFITKRLLLKKDAKRINNEDIATFLSLNAQQIKIIDSLMNDKNLNFYQWGIFLLQSHELIGTIGVVNINEEKKFIEINYYIEKKYRNQGYATEALRQIIDYFFNQVKIKEIRASHSLNNLAAQKVLLKCGMTFTYDTFYKDSQGKEEIIRNYSLKNSLYISSFTF